VRSFNGCRRIMVRRIETGRCRRRMGVFPAKCGDVRLWLRREKRWCLCHTPVSARFVRIYYNVAAAADTVIVAAAVDTVDVVVVAAAAAANTADVVVVVAAAAAAAANTVDVTAAVCRRACHYASHVLHHDRLCRCDDLPIPLVDLPGSA